MKNKKIIAITVLIIAALLLGANMLKDKVSVDVVSISLKDVTDSFEEKGTVKIGEPIEISSTVSGDIEEVFIEENSYVKKGEPIIKVSTKNYEYEKKILENNVQSYYAQINDIINSESYDKKDIHASIKELSTQLEGYKKSKEQSEINKISSLTPEEYLESLKLEVDVAQNEYDYIDNIYKSHQSLYELEVISKNELLKTETSWLKAKSNLSSLKAKYNQSVEKLEELIQLGIDESNLNSRFFEGQYNDIDYAIKTTQVKIDALNEKISNDYSIDAVSRIEALIEAEKTAIEQVDEKIGNCIITAPNTGYITNCNADKISSVIQGQSIATLKSQSTFIVYSDVLTGYVPYLKEGQKVLLKQSLKSEDKTYNGEIKEIYNFAVNSYSALGLKEQRVRVIIDLLDSNVDLYDGYELDVKFEIYNQRDKLSVPNSAVFKIDEQNYVFKAVRGKAVTTPVETEYKTNKESVIKSGIEKNDTIIYNSNIEGLTNGSNISVKK